MPAPRRKWLSGNKLKEFGAPVAIAILLLAAEHSGGGFSDSLFHGMSSLFAASRDQVANQFISQSVGWAAYVLFSMALLGIVTAIGGGIRVAHPPILKVLVGRARESNAAAEVDRVSSTLHEVCELWNGLMRARTKGSSPVLIFLPSHKDEVDCACGLLIFREPAQCLGK